MWPGTTVDEETLLPVAERIRDRFGVKGFCIVADRGMLSEGTIQAGYIQPGAVLRVLHL